MAITASVTSDTFERMDLLRFATIGSVDDGKSTLIGRLLVDTKQLFDDQLDAVETASVNRGAGAVDLSFITDGLRAERDQGITIDVAYRYATTPTRKFVIADCPGHVQYTRNMATGASTADLALVVLDARVGLKEQTRRHSCIAALLGVREFVVCVNKMDLIDWDQNRFQEISATVTNLLSSLGATTITVIPVSALLGDNVADRSTAAPWYLGPTVLDVLESARAGEWAGMGHESGGTTGRLPVQWVLRHPGGGRSYGGMVAGSPLRVGDLVTVWPEGLETTIAAIETADGSLSEAPVGLSVSLHLASDLDVSRGDMIAARTGAPDVTNSFEATVCWFGEQPLRAGARLRLKHTTKSTPARLGEVSGIFDINDLAIVDATEVEENQIGIVTLVTAAPLVVDSYRTNRITGSFVLIDEATNATVAAGMVGRPHLTEPR